MSQVRHRAKRFWICLRRSVIGAYQHGALGYAKGAAYSALLSFFPLLTAITTLLVSANAEKVSRRLFLRTPPEKYATAFVARLDPASHDLVYTNAGHNPAILVRRGLEILSVPGVTPDYLALVDDELRPVERADARGAAGYRQGGRGYVAGGAG